MRVCTGVTLFLLLVTLMGRYPLTRSTKHVCSYKTCFVTGPSQYKFRDEQQIEEKSTLLI
jgi:hypothetical protein